MAETERRAGVWVDLGLHLGNQFLNAGLPWPTIKAELPIGGEPGSFIYRWITETPRSLLPYIEQFSLASADELDLDTLAREWSSKPSRCELNSSVRFSLGHGPGSRNKSQARRTRSIRSSPSSIEANI